MDDCPAVTKLLHPFLDGELTDAEHRRVNSHVQACPECRDLVEAERAFIALVRRHAYRPAPSGESAALGELVRRRLTTADSSGVDRPQ
jgi:anti-sigma factor (TIGR02949 family)